MFRFIGLVWDAVSPAGSAMAASLGRSLQTAAQWQGVLTCPGLQVFAAGGRQGNNQAYPLHGRDGVVLGKLFRRLYADEFTPDVLQLSGPESAETVRTGGRTLIDDFWGRYVAFISGNTGNAGDVLVVRDPSGSLPCFVMKHEGVSIVFSWLEDVLTAMPQVPVPRVGWQALAAHLAFGELLGPETPLEHVMQVLPGEVVRIAGPSLNGALLWNPVDKARAPAITSLDAAAQQLRQTVRACVQSWAACHESILLRLSGGVDSSIVLGCLGTGRTQARVTCVNYHSPGSDSDERHFARLAATRAGRELIERRRDSDFRLERVLDVARTPAPPTYVGRISARSDVELAVALDATAMFTGGGGDQLFFEFHEWWPAADYLRVRGLGAGFAAAAMEAARLGRVSVWRVLRLALADRFRTHTPLLDLHRHWTLVSDLVRDQSTQHQRFEHPCLRDAGELPIGKLMQTWQLLYSGGYYDPYERDAAPELVNPLLSQPVVDLCLALPTYLLACGGKGRGLARQAFAADLPAEIAGRRSKGGMEEHLKAVLQHNVAFARQLLLDGQLVRHGLLDRAAVEAALSGRQDVSVRAGEIHRYVGIEAWLQRFSPW